MEEHAVIVIKNENQKNLLKSKFLGSKKSPISLDFSDNEFLFIKRSISKKTLPGAWSFPSGTIKSGEKIFDTIKREAMEELNINVLPIRIFAEKELLEFNVKLIFVLCKIVNGNLEIRDFDEIEQYQWMKISDFFNKYSDDEIGHGLIYLRKNPQILNSL